MVMRNSLITICKGTYFFIAIFFIACFSSPPPPEDNINLTEVIDFNSPDTLQNTRLDELEESLISTAVVETASKSLHSNGNWEKINID